MGLINPHNPAINAIILYIIFIVTIFILKPSIIYDYQRHEFKTMNNIAYYPPNNNNLILKNSILRLTMLGAFSSIIIYYIFAMISNSYKVKSIYRR